jgi:cobalamin transport system ATP-binding protein
VPEPDGLVLDSITAGYGGRPVVEDCSIKAGPGELVGLIGPNGSGKTTLVRVASRALRPMAGRLTVGGRDPYGLSARQAARLVAVVPQEVAPAFSFTVLEVVLMGRSPYRSPWGGGTPEDWTQARRAMAAADVQHLADRPLEELSGGERQRVVLAQALAQDAPVLLLDEPTTHLDIRHVVDVLNRVRSLVRLEGKAVLAIFHDLNLASAYCDRIYALDAGRIVASGSPGTVITRDLIRDVFGLEADVTPSASTGRPTLSLGPDLAGEPGVAGAARAHVIGGAGTGAEAMRALAEAGYEVTVGVLHAGDTDAAVAERLGLLRITVPPFSPIDARSAEDCLSLIRAADLLVVADPPFGQGNLENLRMAVRAAEEGTRTVLLDRVPIQERDFTGGEAGPLWIRLVRAAELIRSAEDLPRPSMRGGSGY